VNSNAKLSLSNSVQIEVDVEKLAYLFSIGVLCAADLRCLNRTSKNRVWALCLKICLNSCVKSDECTLMVKRSIRYLSNRPSF
jgi:hypothetical protein